jgi:hypothetical protein
MYTALNEQSWQQTSRVEEVEKIINLAVDCGIEKDEKVFFYAINKIFGEPRIEQESLLEKMKPYASIIINALAKSAQNE